MNQSGVYCGRGSGPGETANVHQNVSTGELAQFLYSANNRDPVTCCETGQQKTARNGSETVNS